MGEESEAALSCTNPTKDDKKTHDGVMAKLDSYFAVRKNVVFGASTI